jgi:hypothetical protein
MRQNERVPTALPSETPQPTRKIFGIGLARTGTTSLYHAMLTLGINAAPSSVELLDTIDHDFLLRHDAFFDNPVPFRYRELDEVFPNARWIVTQRPVDDWLASMQWLFGEGLDRLDPATRALGDRVHRDVYGTDTFDSPRLSAIYTDHYASLADWVTSRDHIWLHLDQPLTWKPICDLLGKPEPDIDFPHANRAKRRRRLVRRRS